MIDPALWGWRIGKPAFWGWTDATTAAPVGNINITNVGLSQSMLTDVTITWR